jgi:hypothetical protein
MTNQYIKYKIADYEGENTTNIKEEIDIAF